MHFHESKVPQFPHNYMLFSIASSIASQQYYNHRLCYSTGIGGKVAYTGYPLKIKPLVREPSEEELVRYFRTLKLLSEVAGAWLEQRTLECGS